MKHQKPAVTEEDFLEIVAHCPTRDSWTIGQVKTQYSDLGLQAIWWQCPTCLGCHVSIKEDKLAFRQMDNRNN